MGDEQLGPDTVNVVHEPNSKGIALGLQPAKSLPSPPSRTTQLAHHRGDRSVVRINFPVAPED